jgi:hypothetical protein
MNISRWHRDTSLLALSLSIDCALRSKEESLSKISDKLQSCCRLGSNNRTIVGLSPRQPRKRIQGASPVRVG